MKTYPFDPATGFTQWDRGYRDTDNVAGKTWGGLTKLEYFAAQAMQGLLASGHPYAITDTNSLAKQSVAMAKALVQALNEVQS